jgi:TM2 domain-containing membrane protein YozV
MGWIHVESGAWPQAADAFEAIQAPNRSRFRIDELTASLAAHGDIAYKNPSLAGFLSIVPGAGQLYCRRPKDALIAFGVNTVFILAAIEAFNNELYAMGSLLTIAELGFYTGNIYNAVSSAHKYNRKQTEDFIRDLRQRHTPGISLPPVIRTNGVILSLTIPF